MTQNEAPSLNVYNVDALLKAAGLVGFFELKKRIGPAIHVYGRIYGIKRYPDRTFFTLKSCGSKIQVQIPSECFVVEGQKITINGVLDIKPSIFHTGLDVFMNGLPTDATPLSEPSHEHQVKIPTKQRYWPLASYLETEGPSSFWVLGSQTGIQDFLSRTPNTSIQHSAIRINDKEVVLSSLNEHLDSGEYSAMAIVRGGDDDTLDIWNDAAFVSSIVEVCERFDVALYVALGHAHRQFLIEKYSDQSFATPTALGESFHQLISTNTRIAQREKSLEARTSELHAKASEQHSNKERTIYRLKIALLLTLVAMPVSILFLILYLT